MLVESSKNLYIPLKLLIIRVLMIGNFIACYKKIDLIASCAVSLFNTPLLVFPFMFEFNYFKYFKNSQFRTFTVILLLFTSFTQVFRTLFKDIATDTVFLCYGICQIFFCIDSAGTALISQKANTKKFSRNEVISLEEGLLIPLKREYNGVTGNIAMLIGCFCTFSRLESNTEVLVLQLIGFILYFFVPFYTERFNLSSIRFPIFSLIFIFKFALLLI